MKFSIVYKVLFIFIICAQVKAQDLPVLTTTSLSNPDNNFGHNGNYAKDYADLRAAYVGTWQYDANGVTLIIKMTKIDKVLNSREADGEVTFYDYTDRLELRYKLVKNGAVLFDNLATGIVDPMTSYGIVLAGYNLYGRILDHTRNVVGSFTAKRELTTGTQKLVFNLNLGNYTMLNPYASYQDGQPLFSLPVGEIKMVKIE